MTKLKFQTISELPDVTQRVAVKDFGFHDSTLSIAVYNIGVSMQALVLSVRSNEAAVHVATRGYIGKAHINKIWDIYNTEVFDIPEKINAPAVLKSLYGIGIPTTFWHAAREIIWTAPTIAAVLKENVETSLYQPVYEDDLSKKVFECLKVDDAATFSVMRNVVDAVVNYQGFPDINDVIRFTTSIIDLYVDNVMIRFGKKEEGVDETLTEINSLPYDFIIPTSVDKVFEVPDDKFKGFRDSGNGYSRSVPPQRDANGVSIDKVRLSKPKTDNELTQDEMVALRVLEKLYGTDVATLMVKGRELMSVTASEGNYTDEGSYFSAEILVEIKIAK